MANSSSGGSSNSVPEVIYQYPSLISYGSERKCLSGICPLCLRSGDCFYCVGCIRNGTFTHTKDKFLEGFAEKKFKKCKLEEQKTNLLKRYEDLFSTKIKAENLKRDIELYTEKIRLLRQYVKHSDEKVSKAEMLIQNLKDKNADMCSTRTQLCEKISTMQKASEQHENKIKKKKLQLEEVRLSLQRVIQTNIKQLVTYIFPIQQVKKSKSEKENLADKCSQLEEAQQTMYVRGHWVFTGNPDDLQYRIVAPCILASGNYTAYTLWTSKDHGSMPLTKEDLHQRDLAIGIGAALTFTAHLVLAMTYYLDVHLPRRLCYSEFCGHELDEEQFLHKVAKLNANIVHLCLSQNVDPALLNPHQTISNLLLLLDPNFNGLGKFGPIEVNQKLMESIEESLMKDLMLIDEESDFYWVSSGNFGNDETETSYPCSEITEEPSQAPVRYATSITGDLMSSMASIWRAATGQK